MAPDANGNIRGIAVPDCAWLREVARRREQEAAAKAEATDRSTDDEQNARNGEGQ